MGPVMMFLPFSYTSTSTFKSDRRAFATYATATSAKRFRQFLQLLSPSRLGRGCARSQHLPAAERYPVLLGVMLIAMTLALVTGCGTSGSVTPPVAIAGSVQGGHRPVSGASVQLYVASSVGLGSVAVPLLQKAVASDSNGNFSIPAEYSCPSASSAIYVVASGGSANSSAGENSALMLTAMLGPCSGLAALGSVSVNEVTTVGSVWPLAHYFTSPTHLGYASNDTSFPGAVSSVPEFINLAQGSSPGTPTSTSSFVENNKLYSLADVFAACVSSSGGTAGDGSPCGELFSMASSAGGSAPTDTMTAAIKIAQNPDNNVADIYDLVKGSTDFEPTVTAAPSDWTLPLSYVVATPSISPVTGTYAGTQDVTISDATEGSTVYYTTDGTVPTSSSKVYTAPISIAVSSTVKAIAVFAGSSSGVASSTLTITSALPPAKLAFLQQPSNALTGATITPAVQVSVEDSSGTVVTTATNPVTLALVGGTGLGGTLTATPQNGVATFSNLSVSTAGSYTLSASSPSLTSATSAGFTITAASAPTAVKLAFSVQPSNTVTQATITPAVQVSVEDGSGNVVTTATNPVTLALIGGTGLAGTLTATPQNGVATFSNLTVSTAGSYTLSASSPSLTPATSAGFTITALSSATCSITSFGAVGNGVTDNTTAIQNTFNYAATNHCTALIPAGTFAYSGNITATGIAVAGNGASSILKATNFANSALILTGTGGSISNLSMTSAATTRLSTPQSAMIWVNNATKYIVQNVLINGSPSVGIFSVTSSGGQVLNNTVENTLADSISQIAGANNITVSGNRVLNSGDDGISNDSYIGDPGIVNAITVQGNTVVNNVSGRGLEVSGGSNITFTGNYVDNPDGYADMYIATESQWNTQSVSNVTVNGNTFVDGGPNQGSAIVYNSEAGTNTITGVTISGNQFVNPKLAAVQLTGSGSETGIVINNNTDYSTGQFSTSSATNASATQTGNQVLAPSAYTTPLVPSGGGCNFSGC